MLPLRYLTFIQYQATYGLSKAELDMISRALLLALVPSMSENIIGYLIEVGLVIRYVRVQ
jgi:hypothetical protein